MSEDSDTVQDVQGSDRAGEQSALSRRRLLKLLALQGGSGRELPWVKGSCACPGRLCSGLVCAGAGGSREFMVNDL